MKTDTRKISTLKVCEYGARDSAAVEAATRDVL